MAKAGRIYELLDRKFPFFTQEGWDNSGLLINSGADTQTVIVCLDVTAQVIDRAVQTGAKVIVSHHPVIFSGIKSIDSGDIVYRLVKNDISVVSAHTNFDKYRYGTCYAMARKLGLEAVYDENIEIGLKARTAPLTAAQLAQRCKAVFGSASCTLAEKQVENIFICAGSGGGMIKDILEAGADCFITGECRYHDMLDLAHLGVSVISVGHDASEKISLETIEKIIKEEFEDIQVELVIADNIRHCI